MRKHTYKDGPNLSSDIKWRLPDKLSGCRQIKYFSYLAPFGCCTGAYVNGDVFFRRWLLMKTWNIFKALFTSMAFCDVINIHN